MGNSSADLFLLRDPVLQFVPEHTTDDAFGIRFTTERAFETDPRDDGFVLDMPRAAMKVLSATGGRITAAISTAFYATFELEGLVVLPPRLEARTP